MKISKVTASVHRFEVAIPFTNETRWRLVVVCRLETESGHSGIGITGGQFLPWSVVAALEQSFFPAIAGMDIRNTEMIHARINSTLNPRSMTGVASSALSALDIAMWDAKGKAAEESVSTLLGGAKSVVESYVTFGYPFYSEEQLVTAAKDLVQGGTGRLKMVVGLAAGGVEEDANRIRAVRDAVGDNVMLMLDANYKYSPVEALRLASRVEDCNIDWFEEPMYQNDALALSDFRNRTSIPVSAGQMEGNILRLRELVERRAVDVLQPNVCYCGGYTEGIKAAHLAGAYNIPIANGGGWPLFNMHLLAAARNGTWVEFHLGMQAVGEQIFIDPPRPDGNTVKIPAEPGLGLVVNEERLLETEVYEVADFTGSEHL